MRRLLLVALFAFLAASRAAPAAIIHVNPGDSIQAAINAANDGDVIQVAAGTYDEAFTLNKAVTLSGADPATTILTYTGPPQVEQLIMLGANTGLDFPGQAVIENFSFYNGGGLKGDNDFIKLRARGVGGQIIIRNNIFDGDGDGSISNPAKGIEESYYSRNVLITDNELHNCSYGVWANNLQQSEISNNLFSQCRLPIGMGGSGTDPDAPCDLIVTDNTIQDAKYGICFARNIHDVTFSYNDITGSTFAAHPLLGIWSREPRKRPLQ